MTDFLLCRNCPLQDSSQTSAEPVSERESAQQTLLLLEAISRLNSKNSRPRLLHQKGVAAMGRFSPYMSLTDYTLAEFLQDPQTETPVTVRFSKTMGELGSGDSLRDTHGFAVRFHTNQGIYDLLCHNMPVYYINDPCKFPRFVQQLACSGKEYGREPDFWNFLVENPEAINLALRLYSNQGTIKSYRFMEGYSINTFKWINENQEELYIRYRWNPLCEGDEKDERRKGVSYQEAEFLAGFSPDCCISDLTSALEEGNLPVYELEVQIMDQKQAKECDFDFLSATLLWPEALWPYMKIGKMTLEKICTRQEGDALCFSPSNLIKGVEFADSKFLEIMAYAHRDGGRQRGVLK